MGFAKYWTIRIQEKTKVVIFEMFRNLAGILGTPDSNSLEVPIGP